MTKRHPVRDMIILIAVALLPFLLLGLFVTAKYPPREGSCDMVMTLQQRDLCNSSVYWYGRH